METSLEKRPETVNSRWVCTLRQARYVTAVKFVVARRRRVQKNTRPRGPFPCDFSRQARRIPSAGGGIGQPPYLVRGRRVLARPLSVRANPVRDARWRRRRNIRYGQQAEE